MFTLRDYQVECIDKINALSSGSGLVCMATGLGKTVVFSHIKRRGRVLILSHREELVYQPIKYYDCPCGVEKGEITSNGEEVVSASVQSIVRRLNKFSPDDFDLIITDEAHHAAAPTYKQIYSYFKPRLHIGFTATPNRGDKVRLDDIYDSIIFSRDLKWGIQNDWLTDIRCLRAKVCYDVSDVKRRMGDFVVADLDKAVNIETANKQIADVYNKYAKGQTLIFATSVAHAENIAREIPNAVVVSQKTKNRKKIIDDFTNRKIPCIVNCMIFTEGTDMPLIETIIIARPTQNQSLYTQMVGRGLRKAEGKNYLTLIDCVGVSGKLDICTAPSLMGLDADSIPESRRHKLQGMLTDMPKLADEANDCPEVWLTNVKAVQLFARSQRADLKNINWTKKPNGDLVYQFACGDRIGIKAINELGQTAIMSYCFDEKQNKFVYNEYKQESLKQAAETAYLIFKTKYLNEQKFWDIENYAVWQFEKASDKQIAFIKGRLPNDELATVNLEKLTKGDAVQIINALQIRNLKQSDLLKMRKKALEEQKQRDAVYESLKHLKIRKIIRGKYKGKFYAIKHPTDLVITDSWEEASLIIAELNASGDIKCKFKSFSTIKTAEEFLRTP